MPSGIYVRTEETKKKMSLAKLGNSYSRGKQNNLGKHWKLLKETRELISQNNGQKAEKHWNWKGGVMTKNQKDRRHSRYYEWRKIVFERDDYTCQSCGIRGVYLHAHHVKDFANHPDLRFEPSNGMTLCVPCHQLTDSYKGKNNGL